MRANGVDERFITGDAPAREKFQKWAETLGRCVGNPVFEWSHLELKRFFGYEGVLNGNAAQEVWDLANAKLADFLNSIQETCGLPKTILYSLNPIDNTMIDTVMGCFQEAPTAGKIQNGSAWWFNDNEVGMREQLTALANEGVLGNFVGMLTDSRSFLSYPRHEYFRRVLCSVIGEWVEQGKYPADMELLGTIVRDISYNNSVRYFGFDLDTVEA